MPVHRAGRAFQRRTGMKESELEVTMAHATCKRVTLVPNRS